LILGGAIQKEEKKSQDFSQRIELVVSVDPSDAIFRGVLTRTMNTTSTSDWKVKGEVDRINKYGNQSHCVDQAILKPFCYCLN
jgi:hypothetical protein